MNEAEQKAFKEFWKTMFHPDAPSEVWAVWQLENMCERAFKEGIKTQQRIDFHDRNSDGNIE